MLEYSVVSDLGPEMPVALGGGPAFFMKHELRSGEAGTFGPGKENRLIFILKGKVRFSSLEFKSCEIAAGSMLIIPGVAAISFDTRQESRIVECCFDVPPGITFTHVDDASREGNSKDSPALDIRDPVGRFLDLLLYYMDCGIRCAELYSLKVREFFLVMKSAYREDEIKKFVSPIIDGSIAFRSFVYDNYLEARNVSELASRSGMGRSTFDLKFKKEFGIPPRRWMLRQISKLVYSALAVDGMLIDEVMAMYGFGSSSSFTRFCRQHLGKTPTELIALSKRK